MGYRGDFNNVTSRAEIRGKSGRFSETERNDFIFFMDEMNVVEPPCLGKKYTWYQPNGYATNRIDRILMSQDLMDAWKVKA